MNRWVRPLGRFIRRAAAGLILLFGLLGTTRGWFQVCEDQILSDDRVIEACRQPSVSDAAVLVASMVFLLLIAKDFEGLGLLGFSLKNRITDQERRTSDIEEKLLVMNLGLEAAATAAATTNVYLVTQEQVHRIQTEIPSKAAEFFRDEAPTPPRDEALPHRWPRTTIQTPHQTTPEAAQKRAALLSLWEQLAHVLDLTPPVHGPTVSSGEGQWATTRARFITLFREELELLRAVRNAAAHSRPIDPSVLDDALEIARELVRIAQDGLGGSPATADRSP